MFLIVPVALQPSICVTLHGRDEVGEGEYCTCAALKPTRAHVRSLLQNENMPAIGHGLTTSASAHTPHLYTDTNTPPTRLPLFKREAQQRGRSTGPLHHHLHPRQARPLLDMHVLSVNGSSQPKRLSQLSTVLANHVKPVFSSSRVVAAGWEAMCGLGGFAAPRHDI
jgi:hypothetical protein